MNQICRLLGISKKTYYYSIDPAQTLEQRYGRLKSMLERIIQKNPSYGYRRIKKALFEVYGEAVNHKVLLKLLLAWGLQFKRRIRKPRLSWMSQILDFLQIRANLVWRLTKQKMITRCLQVIVSDVTELYYQGKKSLFMCPYGYIREDDLRLAFINSAEQRACCAVLEKGGGNGQEINWLFHDGYDCPSGSRQCLYRR